MMDTFNANLTPLLQDPSWRQHTQLTRRRGNAGIVTIATDGSEVEEMVGWGFFTDTGVAGHGPVPTDPADPAFIGARFSSNNTAELTGIAEALIWVLRTAPTAGTIHIKYDSQYAARISKCTWHSKSNKPLAATCRKLVSMAHEIYDLTWEWVKGHTGDEMNEKADEAADDRRKGHTNSVGRFDESIESQNWLQLMQAESTMNTLSPSPPAIGSLEETNLEWSTAMTAAANLKTIDARQKALDFSIYCHSYE
jgi:ribonuclease HI